MKTLLWTVYARERLTGIHEYIELHSPGRGDAQIVKLIRRAEKIVQYPSAGRMVREYEDNAIREVLERPYRIIYQINDDTIVILTVMHYRQLLPADIHAI